MGEWEIGGVGEAPCSAVGAAVGIASAKAGAAGAGPVGAGKAVGSGVVTGSSSAADTSWRTRPGNAAASRGHAHHAPTTAAATTATANTANHARLPIMTQL